MKTTQDPEYDIRGGKLVSRATGEAIPDDEPVFILRASDRRALSALIVYYTAHEPGDSRPIAGRIEAFKAFARAHPEKMQDSDAGV